MASMFIQPLGHTRPLFGHQAMQRIVRPRTAGFYSKLSHPSFPLVFRYHSAAHQSASNVVFQGGKFWCAGAGLFALALGVTSWSSPAIHCEPTLQPKSEQTVPEPRPVAESQVPPPPPKSAVNLYELSFGTVCGICSGIFIKKGAKMVAFFLGGVFVILQYLGSLSLVRVNWTGMASRFENLFYTKDIRGNKKAPTFSSLFKWIIDFLTADFQPRASFIAGLALGLRIG